jgi:hypothetical protein
MKTHTKIEGQWCLLGLRSPKLYGKMQQHSKPRVGVHDGGFMREEA